MNENKSGFVQGLGELLAKYSREKVVRMDFDEDAEKIIITFENGYVKSIEAKGWSCVGILDCVFAALV